MVDADLASAVQHYRSVIGASVQNRPIGPIESCAQDDQALRVPVPRRRFEISKRKQVRRVLCP